MGPKSDTINDHSHSTGFCNIDIFNIILKDISEQFGLSLALRILFQIITPSRYLTFDYTMGRINFIFILYTYIQVCDKNVKNQKKKYGHYNCLVLLEMFEAVIWHPSTLALMKK